MFAISAFCGLRPNVLHQLLDGGPSATKKESAFTSYLQNMENPVWDGERLQMRLTPGGDRPPKLRVEMWDKDMFTPDEMIASGTVELPEAQAEGAISMRLAGVNGPDGDVPVLQFSFVLSAPRSRPWIWRSQSFIPSSATM